MENRKNPIYIILPSRRMEFVMSGPSGEPKMICVTPALVRSSHFWRITSGVPQMVNAAISFSVTSPPTAPKSKRASASLIFATFARSRPWRWSSASGEPAAMNAATIFAAFSAFFWSLSMDRAVYAPTSKFFLPTFSVAALIIGIATSKSFGLDALISAPSPFRPALPSDLQAQGLSDPVHQRTPECPSFLGG